MKQLAAIPCLLLLLLPLQGCGLGAIAAFGGIEASKSDSSGKSVATPTVTSVTPAAGSHAGGLVVTIDGAHFPSNATVSVGGIEATTVSVSGSSSLQATLAATNVVGAVDVVVNNPNGGSGTLAGGFTLTNTTSAATVGAIAGNVSGNVVFSITLTDAEGDTVDVNVEYDDGGGFQAIPSNLILSGSLTGLASSPGGTIHNLTWNSVGSLGSTNANGVVLRVTPTEPIDGLSGTSSLSNPFNVQNNTAVDVELIQPASDAFNVQLAYRVTEADGDAVTVTRLEYRDVSSGQTGPLTVLAGLDVAGVALASAAGVINETLWDSLTDLGRGNNRLVEITVEVTDGTNTVIETSLPFFVSNGPLADQVVVDADGLDIHGFAVGDVIGNDGLPDLIAVDTRIDGSGVQFNSGGAITVARNRRLSFDAAVTAEFGLPAITLLNGHPANGGGYTPAPVVDPDDPPFGAGGPLPPYPNYIASNGFHPSEVVTLRANNDASVDIITAHSPHGPFTQPNLDLARNVSSVLANVGLDISGASPFFTGGAATLAHQQTYTIPQDVASGTLDYASATWEQSWALRTRVGRLLGGTQAPIAGGVAFATQVGFFTQDLLAAELDAGEGGGEDLVILQGIGDAENAIGASDVRGLVVVRKRGAGLAAGALNSYLDQSVMGLLPTHVAVADLTHEAHDGVTFNPHPLTGVANTFPIPGPGAGPSLAAGTPDILVANTGDNSLTFYLHTDDPSGYGGDPNVDPPEYYGQKLNLQPIITTLTGGATTLPAGDLRAVAIGDLNGDGKNDFVTVHQLSRLMFVWVYDPVSGGPLSLNANQAAGALPQSYSPAVLPPFVLPFRLAGLYTLPGLSVGRPKILDLTGDGQGEIVVPMGLNNEVVIYEPLGPAFAPRAGFGEGVGATPDFGGAFDLLADPFPATPAATANPTPFTSEFTPFEIECADLNTDGIQDVVAAASLSFDMSVFYQVSAGTLDRFIPIPVSGSPFILDSGNVQGVAGLGTNDDVVVNLPNQNSVQVFTADAAALLRPVRTFNLTVPAPTFPKPSLPFVVHVSEVTGDGFQDIITATELFQTNAVTILGGIVAIPGGADISATTPSFQAPNTFGPIGFSANGGDLNNDLLPELVLASNQGATGLDLYPGITAAGTFDAAGVLSYQLGSLTDVVITNLDGQNGADIVLGVPDAAVGVRIHYGNGAYPINAGAFVNVPTPTLGPPIGLRIADLDGNGLDDIVVTGFIQSTGGIMLQTTPQNFTQIPLVVGGAPGEAAVGDLNGDGRPDIAIPWGNENLLAVYYQVAAPAPAGSFLGPATFSTAATPVGCVILDVNLDGKNDVVVSARGANALNVFLQR